MKIALDVMGGDFAPQNPIGGVKLALESLPSITKLFLVGVPEVIEKANNTPYGLSAGVWCDKGARLFQITAALDAGVVWGNTFNKFDPTSPFGGYKESGYGREGGVHGLGAYLNLN